MRCKRCGTPIQVLDHMCQGCGKSIIALREDNEIIYNDEELSQVEIEKMKKQEEPINQEERIENNDNTDIFNSQFLNSTNSNQSSNLNLNEENVKQEENSHLDIFNSQFLNNTNNQLSNLNEETVKQEDNSNLDIFGDSLFNNQNDLNIEPLKEYNHINDDIVHSNINIEEVEAIDLEEKVEQEEIINSEKISERINTTPIIENINTDKLSESAITEKKETDNEIVPTKIKEKKKSKLPLILIIIAFILLIITGVVLYFFIKTSPKLVFNTVIDKLDLNQIEIDKTKNEMKITLNINEDNVLTDIINDLDINIISHIDNNKMYLKLNPLYKNKELIDADIYFADNEINLYLNDIYDKYISIIQEEYINIESFDIDNLNKYFEEMKKEFKKCLNSKYLTRSIEKINDEYVTKSIFTFDKTNYEEFLNNAKSNKELINALAKMLELTEEEVMLQMEESQNLKDDEKMEFILYTTVIGKELLKVEFNSKYNETNSNLIININNNVYEFIYKDLENNIENNGSLKIENIDKKTKYTLTLDNLILEADIQTTYNQPLSLPNKNEKILLNELTEEDTNLMMTNLMNNEGIIEILNIAQLLFGNFTEEPNDFFEE